MKFVALSDELQDSPKDSNGKYPIVVGLGEESIAVLHELVSAIGGNATIFVPDSAKGAMLMASAIDANCVLRTDHAGHRPSRRERARGGVRLGVEPSQKRILCRYLACDKLSNSTLTSTKH